MSGTPVQTHAAHQDLQGGAESCCEFMDEAPAISTPGLPPDSAKIPLSTPALIGPTLAAFGRRIASATWLKPPPRSLPYHARSARILL